MSSYISESDDANGFSSTLIPPPPAKMTTSLDYLKQTGTVVVSDSGDFECAYNAFGGRGDTAI